MEMENERVYLSPVSVEAIILNIDGDDDHPVLVASQSSSSFSHMCRHSGPDLPSPEPPKPIPH